MITYWGIIGIVVALWFATGWYLNERLKLVHNKLDRLFENFHGLQKYLYEIDPQFDEERRLLQDFFLMSQAPCSPGWSTCNWKKGRKKKGIAHSIPTFSTEGFVLQFNNPQATVGDKPIVKGPTLRAFAPSRESTPPHLYARTLGSYLTRSREDAKNGISFEGNVG